PLWSTYKTVYSLSHPPTTTAPHSPKTSLIEFTFKSCCHLHSPSQPDPTPRHLPPYSCQLQPSGNAQEQRSSTGGPRPPGGPRKYCRGSAKLFHLKHFCIFSLFQKFKTSKRLHKHKQNVKIAFYSLKIIHRLPMSLHAII